MLIIFTLKKAVRAPKVKVLFALVIENKCVLFSLFCFYLFACLVGILFLLPV